MFSNPWKQTLLLTTILFAIIFPVLHAGGSTEEEETLPDETTSEIDSEIPSHEFSLSELTESTLKRHLTRNLRVFVGNVELVPIDQQPGMQMHADEQYILVDRCIMRTRGENPAEFLVEDLIIDAEGSIRTAQTAMLETPVTLEDASWRTMEVSSFHIVDSRIYISGVLSNRSGLEFLIDTTGSPRAFYLENSDIAGTIDLEQPILLEDNGRWEITAQSLELTAEEGVFRNVVFETSIFSTQPTAPELTFIGNRRRAAIDLGPQASVSGYLPLNSSPAVFSDGIFYAYTDLVLPTPWEVFNVSDIRLTIDSSGQPRLYDHEEYDFYTFGMVSMHILPFSFQTEFHDPGFNRGILHGIMEIVINDGSQDIFEYRQLVGMHPQGQPAYDSGEVTWESEDGFTNILNNAQLSFQLDDVQFYSDRLEFGGTVSTLGDDYGSRTDFGAIRSGIVDYLNGEFRIEIGAEATDTPITLAHSGNGGAKIFIHQWNGVLTNDSPWFFITEGYLSPVADADQFTELHGFYRLPIESLAIKKPRHEYDGFHMAEGAAQLAPFQVSAGDLMFHLDASSISEVMEKRDNQRYYHFDAILNGEMIIAGNAFYQRDDISIALEQVVLRDFRLESDDLFFIESYSGVLFENLEAKDVDIILYPEALDHPPATQVRASISGTWGLLFPLPTITLQPLLDSNIIMTNFPRRMTGEMQLESREDWDKLRQLLHYDQAESALVPRFNSFRRFSSRDLVFPVITQEYPMERYSPEQLSLLQEQQRANQEHLEDLRNILKSVEVGDIIIFPQPKNFSANANDKAVPNLSDNIEIHFAIVYGIERSALEMETSRIEDLLAAIKTIEYFDFPNPGSRAWEPYMTVVFLNDLSGVVPEVIAGYQTAPATTEAGLRIFELYAGGY